MKQRFLEWFFTFETLGLLWYETELFRNSNKLKQNIWRARITRSWKELKIICFTKIKSIINQYFPVFPSSLTRRNNLEWKWHERNIQYFDFVWEWTKHREV